MELTVAIREAGRSDLFAVTAIGVEISAERRNAFIPDVAVIDTKPIGGVLKPENLLLAVEIWSPGDSRREREDKRTGYAEAGIPFFWTVHQERFPSAPTVVAHRLDGERYVEDVTAVPGTSVTITAAPVPVTFDPANLWP
ncbi:putative restriction endonuclease [Streptoalloteichus tenebrarius]|uniref:Restriction endonuclease n=1 Tax=Streptoalloteichus tenebrarius (strain ATCC 17920 / DSM 40477 / JCM 4838 / CBS 697.72 / NBRC 16177 / NCIMB 11028 / NRRL B-12390 / A12253. 1 / ISP 5477) TaxID=1933 RepID=A0ABT1I0A3_STRSD|nr:putative restriction endonuclease [Streptoalloteichus tenebrarius]